MKTSLYTVRNLIALALLSTLIYQPLTSFAQGTAFTYQGRLNSGTNAAHGSYDLTFALFSVSNGVGQVGATVTNAATAVSNGVFSVALDFGPNFPGADRWLEIGVRTNGLGAFATLAPRQKLTPAPYAIYAGGVSASGISGTIANGNLGGAYGNAVTLNNPANSFTGNGAALSNVNALTLGGLGAANFWQLGGNSNTTAGLNFLGTTDNQPLELKVSGARVVRLEPNSNGAPNVIEGAGVNFTAPGVAGAAIGGGGATNFGGVGYTNSVSADFGTISGGRRNTIQTNAVDASIGGGRQNTIQTNAGDSTIAGGVLNTIQTFDATVSGGAQNTIQSNAYRSVIGGGYANTNFNGAYVSTIGGGAQNTMSANGSVIGGGFVNVIQSNASLSIIGGGTLNTNTGPYAVVPGGDRNVAGTNSFGAGHRAKATHTGSLVWADSTDADFASTGSNQFLIRASGGVAIGTNDPAGAALRVAGAITAAAFNGDGAGLANLNPANLASGTVTSALTFTNPANAFSGVFNGNGTGVTNVHLTTINSFGSITWPGKFVLASAPSVGGGPLSVTAVDVNGDGKADLISANSGANTLTVLTNDGAGGFVLASSPAVGAAPQSVTTADVNGDGKADLISANVSANTLTVLTNNGVGGFVLASSPVVGSAPRSVTTADVNGDGKPDLISANALANTLTVLTNNGSGGFVLASSPAVGGGPVSVTAADVNGDGKMDLICANNGVVAGGGSTLTVLTNNGSGGFVLASSPVVGGGPRGVTAADVNGDGKVDLICANGGIGANTLIVLTNDGSGGFAVASSPAVGSFPQSIAAVDVNADGRLDLISANYSANTLTVLINSGGGNFAIVSSPAVGGLPVSVVAVDLNGDGRPDLISANSGDNTLSVLFNTPTFNGSFKGDAAGLINLNASQLASGTVSDTRLSANVALRVGGNTFTGNQILNGDLTTSGKINADGHGGMIIENRTSDPLSPAPGQIWLRTD